MRLVVAVAGVLIAAGPASAQYIPRPIAPIGSLPAQDVAAQDVAEIVQAIGLEPMGPPMPRGALFVQRATDHFGRVLRVTVDARRSQVISVEAAGAPRTPQAAYAGYGAYRPYPGYAAFGPDDDADLAPPGSIMAPRAQPPHSAGAMPGSMPPQAVAPRPAVKSAAVTPARPPVPRKRPAAAPQEAAGSVDPLPAAQKTEGPAPAQGSTPPINPLE